MHRALFSLVNQMFHRTTVRPTDQHSTIASSGSRKGGGLEEPLADGTTGQDPAIVQAPELFNLASRLGDLRASFVEALDNEPPLDLRPRGATSEPLTGSIPVEIRRNPVLAKEDIGALPKDVGFIMLRGLEQFPDYRGLLSEVCAHVSVNGWILLCVPSQFLFERKLQLPSRYGSGAERFYTPSSLLREVEEALDPVQFRVRLLFEDDAEYDTSLPLDTCPRKGYHIKLLLQRVSRPDWADKLVDDGLPVTRPDKATRVLPLEPIENAPYHIVSSATSVTTRVAILKLDHRGDYILAEPALRELRQQHPDAELTMICGSWNAGEAKQSGLFQEVVAFDFFREDSSAGKGATTEDELIAEFSKLVTGKSYDLVIDLRLFEDTRKLLRTIDAKHKAGFDRRAEFPWLNIPFNLPFPTREGRAEQGFILAKDLGSRVGDHKCFAIDFDGRSVDEDDRCFVWGPYQDFMPGEYIFTLHFDVAPDARTEVGFDLAFDSGRQRLIAGLLTLEAGKYPSFFAKIHEPIDRMEIRLFRTGRDLPRGRLLGISYRRKSEIFGLHQQEAMLLLVKLAGLRLQQAFKLEA